jgi:hypothetical protein
VSITNLSDFKNKELAPLYFPPYPLCIEKLSLFFPSDLSLVKTKQKNGCMNPNEKFKLNGYQNYLGPNCNKL